MWHCEKCKIAFRTKEDAEKCCVPKYCEFCGNEFPSDCDHNCLIARTIIRIESNDTIEKISEKDWDGYVCELDSNQYHENIDAFYKYWEDQKDDDGNQISLPKYVWACDEIPIPEINTDWIIKHLLGKLFEGDEDCLDGITELQTACDAFNEANKSTSVEWPNYIKAVVINGVGHKS